MENFTPTLGVKDSVRNIKGFVKEHKPVFWSLMKSVLPLMLALIPVLVYLNFYLMKEVFDFIKEMPAQRSMAEYMALMKQVSTNSYADPLKWLGIGISAAISYCYAVIAVSWHRLVIKGLDNWQPMSPFRSQRHEVQFVIMWTIMGVFLPMALTNLLDFNWTYFVLSLLVVPFFIFKISFYFPAKAVNVNVSFGESFRMTDGYFWKFLFTVIRVYFLFTLLCLVVVSVVGFLGGMFVKLWYSSTGMSIFDMQMYTQIFVQPTINVLLMVYFQPIYTILGVTTLSNFYLHAVQNPKKALP